MSPTSPLPNFQLKSAPLKQYLEAAGSIPNEDIDIFQSTYSFYPHYSPGVDSVLTEMSTRNLLVSKARSARKAYICEPIV
jgi:hypothetical protein